MTPRIDPRSAPPRRRRREIPPPACGFRPTDRDITGPGRRGVGVFGRKAARNHPAGQQAFRRRRCNTGEFLLERRGVSDEQLAGAQILARDRLEAGASGDDCHVARLGEFQITIE
jgi:hypothetical protein